MSVRQLCLALIALALTACLGRADIQCSDGTICPVDRVCAAGGCALPEQVTACDGIVDDTPCTFAGTAGHCTNGVCIGSLCGNALIDSGEVCDDGNTISGDGCRRDCLKIEVCGDGVIDIGEGPSAEECDGDVGCHADCKIGRCGDGIKDAALFEECDDGAANSDVADASCRTSCRLQRCGDGITDTGRGEVCDDGNFVAGDGCTPDCLSAETCGNGYLDFLDGELCDDGNSLSHDGCFHDCRFEAPVWTKLVTGSPAGRIAFAMAYDAARGQVVLFGGNAGGNSSTYQNDTWVWDGHIWSNVTPTSGSPPAHISHAMAYDAARQRVVLFGGRTTSGLQNDTWEWNGTAWTNVTPTVGSPAPREGHAMAYDSVRRRVVLFGGYSSGTGNRNDTWEWDGTAWIDVTPTSGSPSARSYHSLAYDAARDRVVMFYGGYGDTWEWNGSAWADVTPASGSPGLRGQLAYDATRGRVVLFGGAGLNETWDWDGSAWSQSTPASTSPVLWFATPLANAIAYDVARGRLVLFTSACSTPCRSDTWEWNGTDWSDVTPISAVPSARTGHRLSYDVARGKVVLFGGGASLADTWEWSGTDWTNVTPVSGSPPGRRSHAMAYDAARDRTLVFGGNFLDDTWEWDGATWTDVTPATGSPKGRRDHAVASDLRRKRVVLFGGVTSDYSDLTSTWEWDGATWSNVTPASGSPPWRYAHAMAYDAARERVVLFGGYDSNGQTTNDTWEWDGATWTDRTPAVGSPLRRADHALVYDAARRRVVLYGGAIDTTSGDFESDTWEWDGSTWTELLPASSRPADRIDHALAYDAIRRATVLFGGYQETSPGNSGIPVNDTWILRYQRSGAPEEACRDGVDSDQDTKVGCADADCWGRCTPSCSPGASCDPTAQRCGDNTCSALENCRLCPNDCGSCAPVCGDYLCDPAETAASCPGDCS